MTSEWKWRAILTLGGFLLSIYILVPTFFNFNQFREQALQNGQTLPWYYRIFPTKQVKLGLDLQGGIHLVLGIDVDKSLRDQLSILSTDLAEDFEKQGFEHTKILLQKNEIALHTVFKSIEKGKPLDVKGFNKIRGFIRQRYSFLKANPDPNGFGLSFTYEPNELKYRRENTVNEALLVLRNRIDEYGVNEPSISAQGRDRILIQLPGVKDPGRAKKLIGRTALLEFKMVEDKEDLLEGIVANKKAIPPGIIVDYEQVENKQGQVREHAFLRSEDRDVLLNFLKGKIPDSHSVHLEESVNKETLVKTYRTYILREPTLVKGDALEDARVQIDPQWNRPEVGLRFNLKGASIFKRITTDHTKERLAIVLDGNIYSAPTIQSPIPDGRARITLGSFLDASELSRQAHDLAIVLRAGSLKAPVEILEDRTIGPTLGADSIRRGATAMVFGGLAVVLFMVIYYKKAGLIADIALVMNGLLILATLVMFQATLTLPGIAGLILTAGMAVDANVIIFERIREELRAGQSPANAVRAGYDRAWWTVFDANITTAIAGIVLMQYGTGPIKGFAVTLLIGIIFSFITAVYVTRVLFDYFVEFKEPERLSI